MSKDKVHTPGYISGLLQPMPGRSADRRVWSIPLAGVLVPFFTATNAAGETAIPADVLGCPLRLIRDKDGTPKFTANGRPVVRVAKELADQVRMVRENFVAGLMAYTDTVRKGLPAEYKAQVEAAMRAGEPIADKDAADLRDFIAAQSGEAQSQAEPEQVGVAA